VNVLLSDEDLATRRAELEAAFVEGLAPDVPPSQTPWQEIQRAMVDQLADGMVLKPAVKYHRVAQKSAPRDNH
jgi:dihydroxy-acid dehydratase